MAMGVEHAPKTFAHRVWLLQSRPYRHARHQHGPFNLMTAFIGSAKAQRFCTGLASSKWAG